MFLPKTYTVETVLPGHPDKICDQISDAILDACLKQDPFSRVACECFGSGNTLVIGGEITASAQVDYAGIARELYGSLGYTNELDINVIINQQSPDIATRVNDGGAGDQGIMYGFACDETDVFLPYGLQLIRAIHTKLNDLCAQKIGFGPDGKAQVTMHDGQIQNVLVSIQHTEPLSPETIEGIIKEKVLRPLIPNLDEIDVLINPSGRFVLGGFQADAGLTGRKIMVDTYCGLIPHGGGAFSGKDATKVDRSGAYMARFVAKQIVAQSHAKSCLVSVAYAIGKVEPLMVHAIDEQGRDLSSLAKQYDFCPLAIIERLDLRQPIFTPTARNGHFGQAGLPWEALLFPFDT